MANAEPVSVSSAVMRDALITMAIEAWRFASVFIRMANRLDAGEQNRFRSQYSWFMKKLDESLEQADLHIVNEEGYPFDPGIAATPLNIDEFGSDDALIVDQMLEPIIMGPEGLVRTGTVMLRRLER